MFEIMIPHSTVWFCIGSLVGMIFVICLAFAMGHWASRTETKGMGIDEESTRTS